VHLAASVHLRHPRVFPHQAAAAAAAELDSTDAKVLSTAVHAIYQRMRFSARSVKTPRAKPFAMDLVRMVENAELLRHRHAANHIREAAAGACVAEFSALFLNENGGDVDDPRDRGLPQLLPARRRLNIDMVAQLFLGGVLDEWTVIHVLYKLMYRRATAPPPCNEKPSDFDIEMFAFLLGTVAPKLSDKVRSELVPRYMDTVEFLIPQVRPFPALLLKGLVRRHRNGWNDPTQSDENRISPVGNPPAFSRETASGPTGKGKAPSVAPAAESPERERRHADERRARHGAQRAQADGGGDRHDDGGRGSEGRCTRVEGDGGGLAVCGSFAATLPEKPCKLYLSHPPTQRYGAAVVVAVVRAERQRAAARVPRGDSESCTDNSVPLKWPGMPRAQVGAALSAAGFGSKALRAEAVRAALADGRVTLVPGSATEALADADADAAMLARLLEEHQQRQQEQQKPPQWSGDADDAEQDSPLPPDAKQLERLPLEGYAADCIPWGDGSQSDVTDGGSVEHTPPKSPVGTTPIATSTEGEGSRVRTESPADVASPFHDESTAETDALHRDEPYPPLVQSRQEVAAPAMRPLWPYEELELEPIVWSSTWGGGT